MLLTARNIFIVNLAISDLLLCIFTMPLTMMDIITKFWILGPTMVKVSCTIFSSLKFEVSGGCLQVVGQFPDHLRLLCLFLNPVDRHGQVQVHPPAQ